MNAVQISGGNGARTVSIAQVPVPRPGQGEVLVRVHATAVTPGELEWYPTWHTEKGGTRLHPVPGHEFSGTIEAMGAAVEGFAPGDAVYGTNNWFINGAAAEYCLTTPAEIAPKPRTIDHTQAAIVPISGLTAWQALFDHGKLQAGEKVLVHGGAGGVGSFAIQLAVWKGATVATTVSAENVGFVRELGAVEIIDYRRTKFEDAVSDADLVLDVVGGETLQRSFRAIKQGGRVVTIASSSESDKNPAVQTAFFIVSSNQLQLRQLTELIDNGHLRPVVSEVFRLTAAAQAYFPTGKRKPGKAVLQILTN